MPPWPSRRIDGAGGAGHAAVGRRSPKSEPDAGHNEDHNGQGINPMPDPQGQGMKINAFHRFPTFLKRAWAEHRNQRHGTRMEPARSIHLKPIPGLPFPEAPPNIPAACRTFCPWPGRWHSAQLRERSGEGMAVRGFRRDACRSDPARKHSSAIRPNKPQHIWVSPGRDGILSPCGNPDRRRSYPRGKPADRSGSPCTSPDRPVAHRFSGPPRWRFPGRYWHRHGMRTLQAEVLDDESIPPTPMPSRQAGIPATPYLRFRSTLILDRDGRRPAVVEFRAGQLATPAPDAPGRVRNDDPVCLFHNDQRLACPVGQKRPEHRDTDDGNASPFQGLPARTHGIQTRQFAIRRKMFRFTVLYFHINSPWLLTLGAIVSSFLAIMPPLFSKGNE